MTEETEAIPEVPEKKRPSDARIAELKKIISEAQDRWRQTNDGEELTFVELGAIVQQIYQQRKLDYIYARIKPVTPADYEFLKEYLAPEVPAVSEPEKKEETADVEEDEAGRSRGKRKGK